MRLSLPLCDMKTSIGAFLFYIKKVPACLWIGFSRQGAALTFSFGMDALSERLCGTVILAASI